MYHKHYLVSKISANVIDVVSQLWEVQVAV